MKILKKLLILEKQIIYNINLKHKNIDNKNNIILECPIYINDDGTDLKKKYNLELNEILNNNLKIDEYVENIIKSKGLKNTATTRKDYRRKIERCIYLNEKYGNNLRLIYFSISKMSRLTRLKWLDWLNYFNIQIKIVNKIIDQNETVPQI